MNKNKIIDFPYDQKIENGIKKRIFKENIDDNELKWHFDKDDRNVKIVKSNKWMIQFDNKLPKELKNGETIFIPKNKYHRVLKGKGDLVVEIKELINEKRSGYRNYIRTIVKDIIEVFKKNNNGTFILPEEINPDENFYDLPELGELIQIEVSISENLTIDDFMIDANYFHNDEIITVDIDYNPNNKTNLLYNLIAELNEIIAHEITHVDQQVKQKFDFPNNFEEIEDPYEYYTQPKEIDAQVKGFKRISYLTKKPFKKIVNDWFNKYKKIHRLDDEKQKKVIDILLKNN